MKNPFLTLCFIHLFFIACSKDNGVDREKEPEVMIPWEITTIVDGCTRYSFSGFHEPTNANQIINVLEVDILNLDLSLEFKWTTIDTLSSIVETIPNAIAAVNGTYGEVIDGNMVSYIKTNGIVNASITIPPSNSRFWKHEGALYYDELTRTIGIGYGANAIYETWDYPNIMSGAPILIDDFEPVGETFADPNAPIDELPAEHPDRMQGVRHPRTAVALTSAGKLLLITVDGRRFESGGMNAKELTQMLKWNFTPQYALNIDGGGSTTMWVKESTASPTGVVNYPTHNGKYDHYGQRGLNNCLVITKN